MNAGFSHTPVLLTEAIRALEVRKGGLYIDATYGGGGYARAIAQAGGMVLAIDADLDAVARAKDNPTDNIAVVHGNFRNLKAIAQNAGWTAADGAVFDLGVSSFQLDIPERGFTYRNERSPLDMRLDTTEGKTAADIVKQYSEEELNEIFTKYGEEERAGSIARAIVRARSVAPITTAGDLLAVIGKITGTGQGLFGTASRIFQALRIEVNDELGALREGLKGAAELLKPNGRLCVVSFHSLEDRIVKRFMTETEGIRPVGKKPVTPGESELRENPRSRSAKLRIAEKIA